MRGPSPYTRIPLGLRVLLAVMLGVLIGLAAGERAVPLGEVALLIIRALKTLATPLLFVAVVEAFIEARITGRMGAVLVAICLLNGSVASGIALGLARLFPVGNGWVLPHVPTSVGAVSIPALDPWKSLDKLVPESVLTPFLNNEVLGVILIAVAVGLGLRRSESKLLRQGVSEAYGVLLQILMALVHLVPIAVLCVIAKVVGGGNAGAFVALGKFVGVVTLGLLVHALLYYALVVKFLAGRSPLRMARAAGDAWMAALSTGSSLATLPLTLKALQERLKVSPAASRLAACIGTNLNNDGIILYEVGAALFVAQAYGVTLDLPQQLGLIAVSLMAAAGIAGVPDAGLITLSLVLSSAHLPLEAVAFLLPVDWFVGRLRAAVNVTSDMVVAQVIDRHGHAR